MPPHPQEAAAPLRKEVPVDLDRICRELKISHRRSKTSAKLVGTPVMIVMREEGHIIVWFDGPAMTEAEKRFAIAHEIGHTFFFRRRDPPDRAEERWCDLFAKALLEGEEIGKKKTC